MTSTARWQNVETIKRLVEELTGRGAQAPWYTWAGKGWGGAQVDADGNTIGFDCSGFVCGVLWRMGRIGAREGTNSDGLWDMGTRVTSPTALDVAVFGSGGDPSHVALVVEPGVLLVDAGGGGSRTQPGGSDWPPSKGKVRWSSWDYRTDLIGYVRVHGTYSTEDFEALQEWGAHVAQYDAGENTGLPEELTGWPYNLRPVWQRYEG